MHYKKIFSPPKGVVKGWNMGFRLLSGTKHERCCGVGWPSTLFKGSQSLGAHRVGHFSVSLQYAHHSLLAHILAGCMNIAINKTLSIMCSRALMGRGSGTPRKGMLCSNWVSTPHLHRLSIFTFLNRLQWEVVITLTSPVRALSKRHVWLCFDCFLWSLQHT